MENILKRAYELQNNCNYEESTELFKKLKNNPAYYETATMEIAKNYKMDNNPLVAIDYFAELVEHNNNNFEAVRELSQTACLSKKYDKAEAVLKCIFDKNKQIIFALEIIKICFDKNNLEEAERLINEIKNDNSENTEISILNAKLKRMQGYLSESADIFESLLKINTDCKEDIYMELAEICFMKGEYDKAAEYFEKVADIKKDKYIYLKLVELYCLIGNKDKSDDAAKRALKSVPQDLFSQDSLLNEIEIIQKKTILKSKMKRLWVTVTSRCNIRCKTCGLWHNKWELPYKTAKEVMENYPYMERLVWLGGEVFLYKHFEEMFDEAVKWNNLKQQIITNGLALNKNWIEKIIRAENTELTFSIDGVTKEVYEEIRQGSNFERVIDNVRYVMETKKRYGIKKDIRMNSVIMKTNYKQIYDLLELAHREGFNQLSLMALHFDTAPNENIFYGDTKDPEALKFVYKAIPVLKEKAVQYGIDLDILLPCSDDSFDEVVEKQLNQNIEENICEENKTVYNTDAARQKEHYEKKELKEKDKIVPVDRVCCKMPWNYMMICDDGNVLLTGSCVKKIGNIYENSINEIWNSEMAQQYRKNMIEKIFPEDMCRTECTGRW